MTTSLDAAFDLDGLLRMDTAARVDAASKAISSGLSPNEVRLRYHDAPPVDGGELPFMQEQNWPIKHLAERPIPEREVTPPAVTLPDDNDPEDDDPIDKSFSVSDVFYVIEKSVQIGGWARA